MVTSELVRRFEEKYVKADSGCWEWTASKAGKGYGQIKLPRQRRQIYAHQLSYLIHKGEIPKGRYICHTCDNPGCVNPDHLFLGTAKDNLQDMKAKNRHLCGSKNAIAKLTEDNVRQIKVMLSVKVPQSRIAAVYGVSQIEISRINTGQRWSHVK